MLQNALKESFKKCETHKNSPFCKKYTGIRWQLLGRQDNHRKFGMPRRRLVPAVKLSEKSISTEIFEKTILKKTLKK